MVVPHLLANSVRSLQAVGRLRQLSLRAKILLVFLVPALALLLNLLVVGNLNLFFTRGISEVVREGLGEQLVALELELNAQAMKASLYRFLRRDDPADLEQFRFRVERFRRYLGQYEALAEGEEEQAWNLQLQQHIEYAERLADEVIRYRREQEETRQALQEALRSASQMLFAAPADESGLFVDPALLSALDRDLHEMVLAATAYADRPVAEYREAFEQASEESDRYLQLLREAAFQREQQAWFSQVEAHIVAVRDLGRELIGQADARERAVSDLERTMAQVEDTVRNRVRVKAAMDVRRSQEELERSLEEIWRGGLLISVAAILVGLLVSGVLVWQLQTAVGHIVETLRHIEAGDLSRRIQFAVDDELGQIAQAFNHMMDEIVRQRAELEQWGHTLEARIAERTEELRQALDDLDALYTMALKLASVRDMKQLLGTVYEEISRLVDIDVFYIAVYDKTTDTVRVETYIERGRELGPFVFPATEAGLAGWIVRTGKPLFIRDVDKEWDHLPTQPRQVGEPFPRRSYLGVPLRAFGEVIGVLSVQRGRLSQPLEERERRLVEALAHQVAVAIENARLYQALVEAARTDPLTGLSNRRHFEEMLQQEVRRAKRYGRILSLVMLDLDDLKGINDTLGHRCGDQLLQAVATILRDVARETDVVARWGGDEFVVLLPETGPEGAQRFVERLYQTAAEWSVECDGHEVEIKFSAGAATLQPEAEDGEALLRAADTAMYEEKARRRG